MIKWKFLNCICIFAAAIFILWVGCNEQPVDTEKADGSDSIASIEAPSNSQATLEEPTTESIVTESSVVESEYYPITEGQRYLGVYVQGPEETDVLADSINTLAWFDRFDQTSDYKISLCLDDNKYIAFITLQPTDWDLKLVSDRYYDDLIIEYFKKLSSDNRANTELFVRLAHEMEMRPSYKSGWYSWQTDDAHAYVNAWFHIVNLGREYAPNVKWVWSPNRADEYTTKYYPGDEYVDYVGLTLNNTLDSRESFQQFYENEGQRDYLEAYNKPIIFGEIAEHSTSDEVRNEYIQSVFDYLGTYDKCIGFIFLNQDIESARQYKFTDCELILDTFIENARDYICAK